MSMRIRTLLLLALGLAPALASRAHGETLRSVTELHTDLVHLSDLFDGVAHDRAIGPSPEFGGRIFVEAPQLDAIAHQFGVDWHSTSAGDRVLLSRPGAPFSIEQAMAVLRPALQGAGVSSDAAIDLQGYAPPMLPPGEAITGDIQGLDYEQESGRFTALLTLAAPDAPLIRTRISGRVQDMVDVPVASRRLLPGDLIAESDVKTGHLRAASIRSDVARTPAQLVGMAVRKPVGPGAPFTLADFGAPVAVRKGQLVHIQLDYPGLLISAEAMAAESGAVGDHVRVANLSSHAMLDAEVIGSGQVRLVGSPAGAAFAYNNSLASGFRP